MLKSGVNPNLNCLWKLTLMLYLLAKMFYILFLIFQMDTRCNNTVANRSMEIQCTLIVQMRILSMILSNIVKYKISKSVYRRSYTYTKNVDLHVPF